MNYSHKFLGPTVSAAIALIAVTNFCIIRLLGTSASSTEQLFRAILPMALPANMAVILVMSVLYHTLQDVTAELDRHQSELLQKTQRDPLTGAASREIFEDRLRQSLIRFHRTDELFAVIMLDLDHFKRVNDLHGHHVGDELLKRAAARLMFQLRGGDTIARFGGDEFVILGTGIKRIADVRRICSKICLALGEPYEINSLLLRAPASVGAVVANAQTGNAADYVRAADMALYEAKAGGRNCFRLFSDDLDRRARRREVLEEDLREALVSGVSVAVHFQPQVSATGELIGAEALFRWKHPKFGDIPASEAIEIAEESDLIITLGNFVFRDCAIFARRFPHLSVAINVSPEQFSRNENLADELRETARLEGVDPAQIELEITESVFMASDNRPDVQIGALRAHGFRLALDNFGTGYSSLSHLRRFKVDRLKLDRAFTSTADLQENIALMRAAVTLAHLLKLEVLAAGIETSHQESIALESGCDALQGHHYGRPMSAADFEHFIQERQRSAA